MTKTLLQTNSGKTVFDCGRTTCVAGIENTGWSSIRAVERKYQYVMQCTCKAVEVVLVTIKFWQQLARCVHHGQHGGWRLRLRSEFFQTIPCRSCWNRASRLNPQCDSGNWAFEDKKIVRRSGSSTWIHEFDSINSNSLLSRLHCLGWDSTNRVNWINWSSRFQ